MSLLASTHLLHAPSVCLRVSRFPLMLLSSTEPFSLRSIQCSEPCVLPGFQTIRAHAATPSAFNSPPSFLRVSVGGCGDSDPNLGVRRPPRLQGARCRLAEFRSAPWWRGGEVQSGRGLDVRSVGRSVAMLVFSFFFVFVFRLNLDKINGCLERNEQIKQVVLRNFFLLPREREQRVLAARRGLSDTLGLAQKWHSFVFFPKPKWKLWVFFPKLRCWGGTGRPHVWAAGSGLARHRQLEPQPSELQAPMLLKFGYDFP